jgi:large subunit ribosomal protein L18
MDKNKTKVIKRERRQGRIRSQVEGSALKPRLNVFRSNTGMFLQLIDDARGITLASATTKEVKVEGKINQSFEAGKLLAEKAKKAGVTVVVFDRGGYKYHGRVKAAADGAREGGLDF